MRTYFELALLLPGEIAILSKQNLFPHVFDLLFEPIDFTLVCDLDRHHLLLNFLLLFVRLQLSSLMEYEGADT